MILFKPAIVGPFIIVRINCSFSCCRRFSNLPGEHMLNRISWEKWKPTWGNSFVGLVEKQLILWGFRPFKCLHLHPTSSFRLLQPVVFENSKLECFVGTQNATCTFIWFQEGNRYIYALIWLHHRKKNHQNIPDLFPAVLPMPPEQLEMFLHSVWPLKRDTNRSSMRMSSKSPPFCHGAMRIVPPRGIIVL